MVFFSGVFTALSYWNSRTKQFGRLSAVRMASSICTYATNLGVGYAGFARVGTQIGANLLGSVVSAGMLARCIWKEDGKLFRSAINIKEMHKEPRGNIGFLFIVLGPA